MPVVSEAWLWPLIGVTGREICFHLDLLWILLIWYSVARLRVVRWAVRSFLLTIFRASGLGASFGPSSADLLVG